ncbi:hypothetical protein HK103_003625 [Boothiomyces macroporosus]|uniref:Crinkler (CRN) family protein n=1 Tax=Boothiomyces macroporosus TaxID=261099 RepID=A0AAD5UCL5_9FUNG|nr:hypothetical protein HK103_003625 [Boothiomyces macroporosus]
MIPISKSISLSPPRQFVLANGPPLEPDAHLPAENTARTPLIRVVDNSAEVRNLTVPIKRTIIEEQDISTQVKKRRLSISEKLVATSGADFQYLDRADSMKILADSLMKRYTAWKEGKKDRNLHPIPFLADGLGAGKSRFLQELPTSFLNFVRKQVDYTKEFRDVFKSAVCINITFSNGCAYNIAEGKTISIEQSVCLRILFQFAKGYKSFSSFYQDHHTTNLSLATILKELPNDTLCIILGIDEVDKVYEVGLQKMGNHIKDRIPELEPSGLKHSPKDLTKSEGIKEEQLSELFKLVGAQSCDCSTFFVPILAGTIIDPMESVVRKSTHPPLHIPLPLLSLESCLTILGKKDKRLSTLIKKSSHMRQLISDCGGHCRTLEILYDGVLQFDANGKTFWTDVTNYVRITLVKRYDLNNIPLGAAIALSVLHQSVQPDFIYPDKKELKFRDLEEKGIVKIENGKVKIPYFFLSCSIMVQGGRMQYSRFWSELLVGEDMWWQSWEKFNWNYVAFRLSLYAHLNVQTVSLKDFFVGAQMKTPIDILIQIPKSDNIQTLISEYRYPSKKESTFEFGKVVLNAPGAPFDAFVYLDSIKSMPLLLVFQMKCANRDAKTPQVLNNRMIETEFNKAKVSIDKQRFKQKPYFVFVMLANCDSNCTEKDLPENCIVISKPEQLAFYGPSFYHRLST